MATALLRDRDRVVEFDDWTDSLPEVGRSALLWFDLEEPEEDEILASSRPLRTWSFSRSSLVSPS